MIRRPPRSTLDRSSAASDVYKRQVLVAQKMFKRFGFRKTTMDEIAVAARKGKSSLYSVSYTHLRAHETVLDIVCRLLLERKTDYN